MLELNPFTFHYTISIGHKDYTSMLHINCVQEPCQHIICYVLENGSVYLKSFGVTICSRP